MAKNIFCGIDFGTSNSTCAVCMDGVVSLVPLEGEKLDLPSAIFFSEDGDVFYGREAIEVYIEGEDGRLMRGLKSILGTALMAERTVVNGSAKYFSDIVAIYLKNIKTHIERHVGQTVDNVVMGRPVHFHDNDPDADAESEKILREIAQKIGFKNIAFQYEPIAAAFAHERALRNDKLSLVVDLGGGTSDFTVIKLSPQRGVRDSRSDDILSTSGVRIGGTNFDKRLSMSSFMPYLGLGGQFTSIFESDKILDIPSTIYSELSDWPRVNFAQTQKAIREVKDIRRTALNPDALDRLVRLQEEKLGHTFLQHVEAAKIGLSDASTLSISMADIGFDFNVDVTKARFEADIADQISKIERAMDLCLVDAGVNAGEIELVVLTGGSSELPAINDMVARKFGAADISTEDKFCSVGVGLAYYSAQVF
jgi:hypothetical chaperone protein